MNDQDGEILYYIRGGAWDGLPVYGPDKRDKRIAELEAANEALRQERDAYRQALRVQCEGNDHRLSDYLRGAGVDKNECVSYSDQLKLVARTALQQRRVIMCDDAIAATLEPQ